jgi:hypothetical protein
MGDLSRDGKLQTWSQIASYLQVSVRTAQLWASHRSLPVHHMAGERTPVFAFKEELEAWLEKTREELPAAVSIAPADEDPDSSSGANATPAGAVPAPPASQANSILSPGRIILVVLALGGVLLGIGLWRWNLRDIATVRIDGTELIARGTDGHELWRHLFQNGLRYELYKPGDLARTYWVGDLDGDRHAEVLFEYYSNSNESESTPLYCFGRNGNLKWSYVNRRTVRDSGGEIVPVYGIEAFHVLPSLDGRGKLVAVASSRMTDQACQVALLDSAGRLLAEYWHPGHLYLLDTIGGNGPGKARLLAAGVNDGEHRATLVVLNPYTMRGASTPSRMADQRFHILDMREAHEELVILFPRSCLDRDEPKTMVGDLEVSAQDVLVRVAMGHHADLPRSVYFEFTPDFRLKRTFPSTEYWQEHNRLEREGKLDHSWHKDMEMLAEGVEYRRGN